MMAMLKMGLRAMAVDVLTAGGFLLWWAEYGLKSFVVLNWVALAARESCERSGWR